MRKIVLILLSILFFSIYCSINDAEEEKESYYWKVNLSGDLDEKIEPTSIQFSSNFNDYKINLWSRTLSGPVKIEIYIKEWQDAISEYNLTENDNYIIYRSNDSVEYSSDNNSIDCIATFTTKKSGIFKCTGLVNNSGDLINLTEGKFSEDYL